MPLKEPFAKCACGLFLRLHDNVAGAANYRQPNAVSPLRRGAEDARNGNYLGWLSALLALGHPGIQLSVFSLFSATDAEHYQYSENWLW